MIAALFLSFPAAAPAAEPASDFAELSLASLLDTEVSVATRGRAQSLRETPGIISVIQRAEIERLGARDIVDLLRLVPGFAFGNDTFGMVFAGVRGLWAADGKILVLLDGQEMHELAYLTVPLGPRFPIEQIERIEIIRGPGAAMYGGSAELGVINIVTRGADDLRGLSAALIYGQMTAGLSDGAALGDTYGRRGLSLAYGNRFGDLAIAAGLWAAQTVPSDRDYTDMAGTTYPMPGNSGADPLMARLSVTWKGLRLRALFERFHVLERDSFGESQSEPLPMDFTTAAFELGYTQRGPAGLELCPFLRYQFQQPWHLVDPRALQYENTYTDLTFHRLATGTLGGLEPLDWLRLDAGLEYDLDRAEDAVNSFIDPDDPAAAIPAITHHTLATHLQAAVTTPWVNATLGGRLEWHSRFGLSVVPRAALTKAYGPFHWKALFSQASRTPAVLILTADPGQALGKTTVTVYELELGYELIEGVWGVVNGFDITVDQPLVYFFDERTGLEGYRNFPEVGTRGFETELRVRRGPFTGALSYSFYDVVGKNKVPTYRVPGKKHVLLGFSPHKLTFQAGLDFGPDLSLTLSGSFLGDQRFAYVADGQGGQRIEELDPELLLNLYLRYRNVFTPGLWLGLGVYNLLDDQVWYPQPYDNGHAPLPGGSLEVLLRIGYDLPL